LVHTLWSAQHGWSDAIPSPNLTIRYCHAGPVLASNKGPGYIGCFVDDTLEGMRALNDYWGKDPGMTIEMCRDMATALFLRYYGVQYSTECYATNDAAAYGKYGPAPSANCTMPCAGNAAEECGGDSVNDVYDIGAFFQDLSG
jgi:hypothetical protein